MLGSTILCCIVGVGYQLISTYLQNKGRITEKTYHDRKNKDKLLKYYARANISHQMITASVYSFSITAFAIVISGTVMKVNLEDEDRVHQIYDLFSYFFIDKHICQDISSAILLSIILYSGRLYFDLTENRFSRLFQSFKNSLTYLS